MDVPVYLINGFLESGKTSFIKTTLTDPEFINKDRILLIVCEEGIEEYEPDAMKKLGVDIEFVDDIEQLTPEYFNGLKSKYKPNKVIIELNGIWKTEEFFDLDIPDDWTVVQVITLVNAETYSNYLANMRSMIMEHLKYSDTIIFNRCTTETDRLSIRRSIKPVNRKAQIIYETAEGIDLGDDVEDPLPFDINADPIVIEDDDFGLWYLDALDNPKKYSGKNITFKAMFYHDKSMGSGTIVPGRFAMQCCANDIAFIGFISRCTSSMKDFVESHKDRDWIRVSAKINIEFRREYKGRGPVLYLNEISDAEPAEEEIVYFT